jgi:uncharacterized protein (TIGR03437 family)
MRATKTGRLLLAAVCGLSLTGSAPAAAIVAQSGDIVSFINSLVIPGANTHAFIQPDDAGIAAWRPVVDALFSGSYQNAANLADPLGYNVVQFFDTGRNRTYYILIERLNASGAPINGLGTYVYNPSACRNLSIQAPHAGGDDNTLPEAATLFADLNATALLVAGTHRCANTTESTCDGTSTVCNSPNSKFVISDVAHFALNYYEPAHEEILKTIPNLITVAIHGEGEHSPDAIVSNGTCFTYPSPSAAALLAAQYNQIFKQLGTTLQAGTCSSGNAATTSGLCAETDVQGRYANQAATLCNCATPTVSACSTTLGCARSVTFPERFIHLEQDCELRQVAGCARPPGVGYQTAVSAFAAVFPCTPIIASVVQGASFQSAPLAPGSFFTLFGNNLGSQAQAGATAAFSLGGVTAQFCGQPARLVYNSGQGQVNGVVPFEVAGQNKCTFSTAAAGYTVPPTPATTEVQVAPQNIAVFPYVVSANLTVPIITNATYQLIGPPASGFVEAQKGGVIVLWTTGGGLTTPAVPDDQVAPTEGAPMQTVPAIQIDGIPANVLYAAIAPGFIGLYQINVAVPLAVSSGQVSLTIASGIGNVTYPLWVQ